MATPTIKSPGKYDSNNVLIWKYANNLWVYAASAANPIPTLGSTDQLNLRRALQALLST